MGQLIERKCPVCDVIYMADEGRLKHGRQTTCSRSCSYQYRAEQLSTAEELDCPVCFSKMIIPPSWKAKKGPTYCSLACRGKGQTLGLTDRKWPEYTDESKERQRANGRIQIQKALARLKETNYACHKTPERKAKSSKAMRERIEEGKINRVSKLEQQVADMLAKAGIDYIAQYHIRGTDGRFQACIDFYIPDRNIAVEVNGTYWHADPRFYDQDALTGSQLRTKSFYERKMSLLHDLGIGIVELWEHDIKNGFCSIDMLLSKNGAEQN